jgi:hypothetical protein
MNRAHPSWNLERHPPKTRRLVSYVIAAAQDIYRPMARWRLDPDV